MSQHTVVPTFFPNEDSLDAYLKKIHDIPMLAEEEEFELARKWVEKKDKKARERLINSHLRLVAKIAAGYRGYGLPYADLIAEGNIGILQATKKFDPDKGYRFSTYARWWVQASIQEYILRTWSLVKVGTTAAQKKLFFNLRRLKNQIGGNKLGPMTDETAAAIAKELAVDSEEVRSMEQRMGGGHDVSLNAAISDNEEGASEWVDWLACDRPTHEEHFIESDALKKRALFLQQAMQSLDTREAEILSARRLEEPPQKLEALATRFHVSKERVRQIEVRAFVKLQEFIKKMVQKPGGLEVQGI